MGDISLVGIVDLMTGEKDPRNLMLVFSILKVVMVEWNIENHTEVGEEPRRLLLVANFTSFSLTLYTTISLLPSDHHRMTPTASRRKI